ncbi:MULTISPECIES: hypothetical protein [unclassified Sinorhizobium]|uniref:hypothetical protein n=1 Tax=unclassified Sinorhizobium TaxID=2613772 RepID=UPI0035269AE3
MLGIAELHTEAKQLLERADVVARAGAARFFDDLDDALRAFRAEDIVAGSTPVGVSQRGGGKHEQEAG